jgi:hypothetical protein
MNFPNAMLDRPCFSTELIDYTQLMHKLVTGYVPSFEISCHTSMTPV